MSETRFTRNYWRTVITWEAFRVGKYSCIVMPHCPGSFSCRIRSSMIYWICLSIIVTGFWQTVPRFRLISSRSLAFPRSILPGL